MAIISYRPPNQFRRHPLRHLPHYLSYATLYGTLSGLAYQVLKLQNLTLVIGLGLGCATLVLTATARVLRDVRFSLSITPHLIIIDEGSPFGRYRIVERLAISQYRLHRNLLGWLTDSGTLELHIDGQTLVFDGLTSFHALRDVLERS